LTLGAAAACSKIYGDPAVQEHYPALIDSASLIGSIQIQNRASIGGNLCNGSPAGDTIPSLIALGAVGIVEGASGRRVIQVEQFCSSPGRTVLGDDEILLQIQIPAPAPRSGAAFLRFIPRNEMDIAVANAAASLVLEEDLKTIKSARVAVGAVAPTPLLVKEAGDALAGRPLSVETFELAVAAVRDAVSPITDMRGSDQQRRHLSGVLVRRALESAAARALKD
jgi:carbon-monoxide dehydrogenase medium subunit